MDPLRTEAEIATTSNILVLLSDRQEDWVSSFCGTVVNDPKDLPDLAGKSVYLLGAAANAGAIENSLSHAARVFMVDAPDVDGPWTNIAAGRVPLIWHGVGVHYKEFFTSDIDYFSTMQDDHVFQSLTESNKPSKAHRSGLYLTPVEQHGDDLHFRLLRCSTSLSGPTAGFGTNDTSIVNALNEEASFIFDGAAPLNHVLAQIYPNTAATETTKQKKAAIKSHADKTKDMPESGIMAFCTFYDRLEPLQPMADDPLDYGHKSTSGLTRLDFRLKAPVAARDEADFPERFSVTLYPNSVFFMPLSTNRYYTHAIQPSRLDAAQLPTRMGYVVRCSSTEAVHRDGATYLARADGSLTKLQPPTPDGVEELRKLYVDENRTDAPIDYGDRFDFSMNVGDYEAPTRT